jgi:hypothetical protein
VVESRNAALLGQLAARLPVAHTRTGWLPQGTGLPGLDGLAAEHRRLLGVSAELGAELHTVRVRFEQEDVARQQALQRGYSSGKDERLPEVTPFDHRQHEIETAEEKLLAANRALKAFLDGAMAEIRRREAGWDAQLAERVAEADAQREEAMRLLAQAEAKVHSVDHMRRWVHRTATGGDHWLIAYDELPVPSPVPQPDLSEVGGGTVLSHA